MALGTGWTWSLVVWLPALLVAPALAWVDWRTRLLPSLLVLPATAAAVVLGLVGWGVTGEPRRPGPRGVALVVARSVFWVLWWIRSAGMGFGDVRLSALLGFALGHQGWGELLVGLYTGFLVFGLPGLALALWRRDRTLLKADFPFGPAMLVGAVLGAWFGRAGPGRRSRQRLTAADRGRRDGRLAACCAGSPRGSPTDPPSSRSSKACPPTWRSRPTTSATPSPADASATVAAPG